jgi:hypothetical protein
VISVQENASAPTITSSIWRRIPEATAPIIRAESASNPRSYRWGKGRKSWLTEGSVVEPEGYQLTTLKNPVFLQKNLS